jgi:hypothetical protein
MKPTEEMRLLVDFQATQQVFYVIWQSTYANSDHKNLTPQKTPKQNELFMGFSGTFTRSKSRLGYMPGIKF